MAKQVDFPQLIQNYRLGLITSYEFIYHYMDFLWDFGAGQGLSNIMNQECSDLAEYLIGIIEGSGNLIENYKSMVI